MAGLTRSALLAAMLAGALMAPARGNDSTAALGVGGLVLVPTDAVEMRSEDLFISLQEVRVAYEFANVSGRDETLLVAFPLPDIKGEVDLPIAVPTEDPVNFVGFSTTVDGRPVEASVEQRVSALGVDRTDLLRRLGLPLAPHLRSTQQALEALPPETWAELARLGLVVVDEYDDTGTGMKKHPVPVWLLRTTFYWEQRFPAGQIVKVEHRYVPSVGMTAGVSFGSPESRREPWFTAFRSKFCLDKAFLDAVDRARKSAPDGSDPYFENRIDYVLKTGSNWAGPIARFRLVVDKGKPENLVSFCGEGVRKIGPTRFEMTRSDFEPTDDISVLILAKPATP